MRFSSSPRLALENVCLKCCIRTQEADAQALNDRIDELEKKLAGISTMIMKNPGQPLTAAAGKPVRTSEKKQLPRKEENSPAVSLPAEDIQGIWKEMMNRLSKEDPRIWGILTQGSVSCTGNREIRWSPLKAEGSEYFIAPLNREEKKKEILECLKQITGTEYNFSAVAYTESCTDESNTEEAYIKKLYDTFGKEPVDIVDSL